MKFNMLGDANHAGPVRLSDVYSSAVGSAKDGVAASQRALYDAYNSLNSRFVPTKNITISLPSGCSAQQYFRYSVVDQFVIIDAGGVKRTTVGNGVQVSSSIPIARTSMVAVLSGDPAAGNANKTTLMYSGNNSGNLFIHFPATNVPYYGVGVYLTD